MSRRGHARAVAEDSADAHNTLEFPDADVTDQVVGAIRFGMDSLMKILKDTVPRCPAEDEERKRAIAEQLEASIVELVKAELSYSHTGDIVNQVVNELNLQDNPDIDAREFLEAVDSISARTMEEIEEYKDELTDDVLKSHPTYLSMRGELESLLADSSDDDAQEVDPEDMDTEADEVDLDDSTADDGETHEVIPELDPITKQPLKDPVRNKHCRHIYGKAAMLQLIKKNSRTRCPALGCTNNVYVKATDLINDPKLTLKITGKAGGASTSTSTPSPKKKTPTKGRKARRGRRR